MFKSTENPSMELLFNDSELIKKSVQIARSNRIRRVIVHCDSMNDLSIINDIALDYPELSIWGKINIQCFGGVLKNYNNIGVIVRTSQKLGGISEAGDILWEIHLDLSEMPNDVYLNKANIIWSLSFKRNQWDLFDIQLDKLMDGYNTQDLMIDNILLPLELIKEHPCNVYLCGGVHCHSQHGNVPRCISVDRKGDMYPYGIMHKELLMGNIFSFVDNFKDYKLSNEKKNFITANKKLYLSIIDKCNHSIIPWFEILRGDMSAY